VDWLGRSQRCAFGTTGGIAVGVAAGIAVGIAAGIAVETAAGIAVETAAGIAVETAAAAGTAVEVMGTEAVAQGFGAGNSGRPGAAGEYRAQDRRQRVRGVR